MKKREQVSLENIHTPFSALHEETKKGQLLRGALTDPGTETVQHGGFWDSVDRPR